MKANRAEILRLLEILDISEYIDSELNSFRGNRDYYGFKDEDEEVINGTVSGLKFIKKSLLERLEILEKESLERWSSNQKGM